MKRSGTFRNYFFFKATLYYLAAKIKPIEISKAQICARNYGCFRWQICQTLLKSKQDSGIYRHEHLTSILNADLPNYRRILKESRGFTSHFTPINKKNSLFFMANLSQQNNFKWLFNTVQLVENFFYLKQNIQESVRTF